MSLKPKPRAFIDRYLESGNGVKSYQDVYHTGYNTAKVQASRMLTKPNVKDYIIGVLQQKMDANGLNREYILNNIIGIAEGKSKAGAKVKPQDELKANELLGRALSLFRDQQEISITAMIPKSIQELDNEYKTLIDTTPDVKQISEGSGEPEPNGGTETG